MVVQKVLDLLVMPRKVPWACCSLQRQAPKVYLVAETWQSRRGFQENYALRCVSRKANL